MEKIDTVASLRAKIGAWRRGGERIAFVPTMGNLHAGHLALVTRARSLAERVVVSIFVNPTQFGPDDDFERYPRTFDADAAQLADAGVDVVFAPGLEEVYPGGHGNVTFVEVPGVSEGLCGAFRPGHFRGVATVVAKLFNMVQPDVAVFGKKDFQQLQVIRRMVLDLCFPVEIVGEPTMREADGLAMSSRNGYLSAGERAQAPQIYRSLEEAASRIRAGERDYSALERAMMARLKDHGFAPEYFSVRRYEDLAPAGSEDRVLVILVAARLGGTRLIDNYALSLIEKP